MNVQIVSEIEKEVPKEKTEEAKEITEQPSEIGLKMTALVSFTLHALIIWLLVCPKMLDIFMTLDLNFLKVPEMKQEINNEKTEESVANSAPPTEIAGILCISYVSHSKNPPFVLFHSLHAKDSLRRYFLTGWICKYLVPAMEKEEPSEKTEGSNEKAGPPAEIGAKPKLFDKLFPIRWALSFLWFISEVGCTNLYLSLLISN